MRLFDSLVGLPENEVENTINFYIHCYKHVVVGDENKKTFLLKLREFNHDLKICGVVIPELRRLLSLSSQKN